MTRVVIVGGGVLGTMHALSAVSRGHEVVHLERDPGPRGASLRNFGLVWVSGRADGAELDLALRARDLWERIGTDCPETGFRANGSLTAVTEKEELAVLEAVMQRPTAASRGLRLVEPDEALRLNPALRGARTNGPVLAALHCALDAAVEPRLVPGALRKHVEASGRYEWQPGHTVTEVRDHAVRDQWGAWWSGDLVILCPGANHHGIMGAVLEDEPVRRVRLQMFETDPFDGSISTSLADGDSLRYYPAFAVPQLAALTPQDPVADNWAAQLLLVQRLHGGLTIGDTHRYEEPFDFDVDDTPTEHLLFVAERLLGAPVPKVRRRWAGVYSQVTNASEQLYLRKDVAAGVVVVTGPGGRGMTLSPAIAEETFV